MARNLAVWSLMTHVDQKHLAFGVIHGAMSAVEEPQPRQWTDFMWVSVSSIKSGRSGGWVEVFCPDAATALTYYLSLRLDPEYTVATTLVAGIKVKANHPVLVKS